MISAKMAVLHTSFGVTHGTGSLFRSEVSESQLGTLWGHSVLLLTETCTHPFLLGGHMSPTGVATRKQTPSPFLSLQKEPQSHSSSCWAQHTTAPLAEGQRHSQDTSGDKTEGKMLVILSLQPCVWAWLPLLSQPLVPLLSWQVQAVALRG